MKDIKNFVDRLVAIEETADPNRLCGYNHINIRYDYISPIKAYFLKAHRIKTITVNIELPEREKEYIIAHELGHALLHNDRCETLFYKLSKIDAVVEKEANTFAMYLLLKRYEDDLQYAWSYDDISRTTGIPKDVLYRYM